MARREVAAHGVNGDPNHRGSRGSRGSLARSSEFSRFLAAEPRERTGTRGTSRTVGILVLVNRSRLASAVVPAVGAHAVRLLRLVAVRALAQPNRLEGVVRAALGRPRFGMSSFWIRHSNTYQPQRTQPYGTFLSAGATDLCVLCVLRGEALDSVLQISTQRVSDLPNLVCRRTFRGSDSFRKPGTSPGNRPDREASSERIENCSRINSPRSISSFS